MRAHHLQHVPFEGLGSIESWIMAGGHTLTTTRLFANDPLPALNEFDLLIVMGGPMSVNDENQLPWLKSEKALIRQAIDAGKRVLGVCLGSQLIAAALGFRVYRNEHREVGWFPIHRTPEALRHPLGAVLPEQVDVFHWHGETFDLPSTAIRLCSSEGCLNQSYAIGNTVLAFQCHLEMTPNLAKALTIECASDLEPAPYAQSAEAILSNPDRFVRTNRLMSSILHSFTTRRAN